MTLTDIKNNIVGQLSKLTIDDFYSDPNVSFAKEIFAELTNQKSDKQIEKYLVDKFPETIVKAKRFPLEQSIADLNIQITTVQSVIKDFQVEVDKLDKETNDKQEKQTDIPKKESQSKSELKEIEAEIQQIKPLANKAPYIKQMQDLEKSKEKKNKEIETYLTALAKLKTEISKLQTKTKVVKESIIKNETEIKNIQTTIKKTQKEIEQLSEKNNNHYKNEYSSLKFLFKTLLQKSISKREVIESRKTGKQITNYQNALGTDDEIVTEKTREVTLDMRDCDFEEYNGFMLAFTNNKNIIPSGWRKLLYQTLSTPLPNLAGTIGKVSYLGDFYFKSKNLELTNIDASALLATKIAVRTNYSVRTADNKIILGLSGGVSATITFREKGVLIAKFQKQQFEIYSNCFLSERFVDQTLYHQTLYHQTGYANISIETPGAFYILTDEFVIEIYFKAAPILFDNNSIIKFAPDISGKAKHKDKIAEQEAEEGRRQQYEDDYYDYDY
jgi:peptidoglycan hydrolase CwlO-like protein